LKIRSLTSNTYREEVWDPQWVVHVGILGDKTSFNKGIHERHTVREDGYGNEKSVAESKPE